MTKAPSKLAHGPEPAETQLTGEVHVASIERQPRRQRLSLHLSDGSALSLTPDIVARFRLATGQSLTCERITTISGEQAREDAMAAALRLIAFRPRSEKEMRQALGRRAVTSGLQDEVITRLRELALLNDTAYAASFVESRDSSSPRSRRLLAQELRLKGVARDLASESVAAIDDTDAAYRAAERRARSMSPFKYEDFERRLGSFLLRRGFGFDVVRPVVRRIWMEREDAAGDEGAG